MTHILRAIDGIAATTTDNTKWLERAAANLNQMNEQEQSREAGDSNKAPAGNSR